MLVEKYLLNQTVSMHLFDKLEKWEYAKDTRPQLQSEFRNYTNRMKSVDL